MKDIKLSNMQFNINNNNETPNDRPKALQRISFKSPTELSRIVTSRITNGAQTSEQNKTFIIQKGGKQ